MRPTRARLRMSARFLRVGELEGAGIDWERDPGFPEPPSMHFALRLKRFTKSAAQKKKQVALSHCTLCWSCMRLGNNAPPRRAEKIRFPIAADHGVQARHWALRPGRRAPVQDAPRCAQTAPRAMGPLARARLGSTENTAMFWAHAPKPDDKSNIHGSRVKFRGLAPRAHGRHFARLRAAAHNAALDAARSDVRPGGRCVSYRDANERDC